MTRQESPASKDSIRGPAPQDNSEAKERIPPVLADREVIADLLPDRFHEKTLRGRILLACAAFGCIAAGVISSLIPVIPGFLLVIAGFVLLGMANGYVRGWINRIDRWLPIRVRRGSRRAQRSARAGRIAVRRSLRRYFRARAAQRSS